MSVTDDPGAVALNRVRWLGSATAQPKPGATHHRSPLLRARVDRFVRTTPPASPMRSSWPDHPEVGHSLNNLGALDLEHPTATTWQHLGRALAIHRRAYGERHPEVAEDLNNLAIAHALQREFPQALAYFEQAHAIQIDLFGPDDPRIGKSWVNLGEVAADAGDLDTALAHVRRGLAILEAALGPNHADLVGALFALADDLLAVGDHAQAADAYRRAGAIAARTLGPDDPKVTRANAGIAAATRPAP